MIPGIVASQAMIARGGGGDGPSYGLLRIQAADVTGVGNTPTYVEIEFLDEDGVDLATGGTAAASSVYSSSYVAAYAFDNNPATAWSQQTSLKRQWIQYSFPEPVPCTAVSLWNLSGSDIFHDFLVLGSNDGGTTFDIVGWVFSATQNPPQRRVFDLQMPDLSDPDIGSPHRYWRVTFIGSDDYIDLAEIYLLHGSDDQTTIHGGSASASSQYSSGYAAANAFDRNTSSRWSTAYNQSGQKWLAWDFGSGNAQIVDGIRYKNGGGRASYQARDLLIEYSDDGSNWNLAHAELGMAAWSSNEDRTYPF